MCHQSNRHSASCCLINDIYVTGKLLLSANHRICTSVSLTDPRAPRQIEGRARRSTWTLCLHVSPRHLGLRASPPFSCLGEVNSDLPPLLHSPAGHRRSEDGGEPRGPFYLERVRRSSSTARFLSFWEAPKRGFSV